MTTDQITLFAILCALFALLAWGRWRYDVVAFLALMASVVSGVVPAGGAFAGFGHPATITVAAILILSRALTTTGATDWIARAVRPATGSTAAHMLEPHPGGLDHDGAHETVAGLLSPLS